MIRTAYIAVPVAQAPAAEAAALQVDPSSSGPLFRILLFNASAQQTHLGCVWAVDDATWTRLASAYATMQGAVIGDGAWPSGLVLDAATANQAAIQQQAAGALTTNRTFIALGSPTNTDVVAQVKALTRQNNALIRLLLSQFDGTN